MVGGLGVTRHVALVVDHICDAVRSAQRRKLCHRAALPHKRQARSGGWRNPQRSEAAKILAIRNRGLGCAHNLTPLVDPVCLVVGPSEPRRPEIELQS